MKGGFPAGIIALIGAELWTIETFDILEFSFVLHD
jgi:hypothetical protein